VAKSATKWHACPTAEYRYIYDGKGERVEKCAVASATTACPTSGTTGTLYWKGTGSDTLAETDLGGNDEEEYLFFGGARIARRDTTSTGTTVAVHYYFSDHLGSHGVIYSQTGTTCEQDIDYYPYGGVEYDYCAGSGVSQNYKFTGKERDAESGLDNFGARYDSSALGRFMTPDWAAKPTTVPYAKFGDPQSLNLYSYVENGPLNRIDPDGHDEEGGPSGTPAAVDSGTQGGGANGGQTAGGRNAPQKPAEETKKEENKPQDHIGPVKRNEDHVKAGKPVKEQAHIGPVKPELKPVSTWERWVMYVGCLFGTDPDNVSPITSTRENQPRDSTDSPEGTPSGQRDVHSADHAMNPKGAGSQTPDTTAGAAAHAASAAECIKDVNEYPQQ